MHDGHEISILPKLAQEKDSKLIVEQNSDMAERMYSSYTDEFITHCQTEVQL